MAIEDSFSYLFEASDLATPVMIRAEEVFQATTAQISEGFHSLASNVELALNLVAGKLLTSSNVVHGLSAAFVGLFDLTAKLTDGVASFGARLEYAATRLEGLGAVGKVAGGLLSGLGASLGGSGLLGFILGPIGPLLKLLQPVLDIVQNALQPAFDVLGGVIENALAPVSFILETAAQAFAPLLQQFMEPLVGLLEAGAVQLGVFVQGLGSGGVGGVAGALTQAFASLMPVAERVFDALFRLGTAVVPVLTRAIETLMPIVTRVITLVADLLIARLDVFTDLLNEVGPLFVDVFGELLTALMPIVEEVAKLGSELLKSVFAPLFIATLRQLLEWAQTAMPVIREFAAATADVIHAVSAQIADFYGNFQKYVDDFYLLFIDPIVEGVQGIVQAFRFEGVVAGVEALFSSIGSVVQAGFVSLTGFVGEQLSGLMGFMGLNDAAGKVSGIFATIQGFLLAPIESLKKGINSLVIDNVNALLDFNLPLIGKLGKITGIQPFKYLAEGGIATAATPAVVGEKGAELILPLQPTVIREKLGPALADLALPGVDRALALLAEIAGALRGTLQVRTVGGDSGGSPPVPAAAAPASRSLSSEDADLDAVPAFGGGL